MAPLGSKSYQMPLLDLALCHNFSLYYEYDVTLDKPLKKEGKKENMLTIKNLKLPMCTPFLWMVSGSHAGKELDDLQYCYTCIHILSFLFMHSSLVMPISAISINAS